MLFSFKVVKEGKEGTAQKEDASIYPLAKETAVLEEECVMQLKKKDTKRCLK